MLDPFTFYLRMTSAVLDMAATAGRGAEMLDASQNVIARRSAMMGDAMRSPFDGNYAELSRMVPEKMDAFGKANTAMAADWWAMQSAFLTQFWRAAPMATKGRFPTFSEWLALSSRNAMFTLRMFERAGAMGDKGLRPIYASATANSRRLSQSAS